MNKLLLGILIGATLVWGFFYLVGVRIRHDCVAGYPICGFWIDLCMEGEDSKYCSGHIFLETGIERKNNEK